MVDIFQTTYSNAFSWMKIYEFQLKFHWSLFLRIQLIIFQHWFRKWLGTNQAPSHYVNHCWLGHYQCIYASLSLNGLNHCGLVTPYSDRSGSTLAQVMGCCLTASNHYLNQCWLIISEVQRHSYSQEMLQPSVTKISLKITYLKLHSNFPGANELMPCCWCPFAIKSSSATRRNDIDHTGKQVLVFQEPFQCRVILENGNISLFSLKRICLFFFFFFNQLFL